MCQRTEKSMAGHPDSVPTGRHYVASTLASWGVSSPDPASTVLDDVLVVATELLGNAVHACRSPISLLVETHRDHIHVGVRDDSPLPALPRARDSAAEGGRGLAIVAALSDHWGQTPSDDGTKWVWADVPVAPGSVLARDCRR